MFLARVQLSYFSTYPWSILGNMIWHLVGNVHHALGFLDHLSCPENPTFPLHFFPLLITLHLTMCYCLYLCEVVISVSFSSPQKIKVLIFKREDYYYYFFFFSFFFAVFYQHIFLTSSQILVANALSFSRTFHYHD